MEERRERLLRRGDYIWGSFIKPERVTGYVVGVNPGDRGDVLGRFPFSESSVDGAIAAARRAVVGWRRSAVSDRGKVVRRYREQLTKYQEPLAVLVSRETGKPLWEARQEVIAAIRAVDLLLEEGLNLLAPRVLDETEARSDMVPHGVVGILTPSVNSLFLPSLQVCAALFAGNTVVFKPSKFTPGVGQAVAEIIDRCKVPRGVFNMVQGSGGAIGHRLAGHAELDALLFTGSYATAQAVRAATHDRPELPALYHMGGKGCAIVLDDAELDRAVYEVMIGAFLTSGQRHNSTARVIVTREVFDRFCECLVLATERLQVGYAFDADTFMGPLMSENQRTRYRRYGRTLLSRGHEPLIEASVVELEGRRGFYVVPAIYLVNWANGNGFFNDEPPGPTLLVYRADDWEEAAALHNELVYRQTTAVFADPANPNLPELERRLLTGAINLNRGTVGASLRLPSSGQGRATNGYPGGVEVLRFLATPRSKLVESRAFDPSQAVPGVRWKPLPSRS